MNRWPCISSSVHRESIRFRAYLSGLAPGTCCNCDSVPGVKSNEEPEEVLVLWTDMSGCVYLGSCTQFVG